MAVNYTEEMVEMMTSKYSANPTRETVEELADELGKSIKSVIGKLSREGVYQKTEYLTKTGEKPKTKVEIVREIAAELDLNANDLSGLDKAPKGVLKLLCESI